MQTIMFANVSHLWCKGSNRLAGILEQGLAKRRIAPRLGDHLRADMRPDLGFVKLDDAIERGAFYIPLLDEDRFEGAHPQLHLRKIGAFTMIVMMFSHTQNIPKKRCGVQSINRCTAHCSAVKGLAATGVTSAFESMGIASLDPSYGFFRSVKHAAAIHHDRLSSHEIAVG